MSLHTWKNNLKPYRLVLFLLLLIAAACQAAPTPQPAPAWVSSDVRLLDPTDAPDPGLDLVAGYSRVFGSELQIRLDWLDHAELPNYDLYVALNSLPGGTQRLPLEVSSSISWDVLLVIPAHGELRALDSHFAPLNRPALRVLRNASQDMIEIALSLEALGIPLPASSQASLSIQAFVTPSGHSQVRDVLGPFRTTDSPPQPLPVLFAFWNSYPAYTPALALRRWDGAHTGPFGGRHGLYNLLRTARAAGIPLALLDLKAPASLSALDYAQEWHTSPLTESGQKLAYLHELQDEGLLILPEFLPTYPPEPGTTRHWFMQKIAAQQNQLSQEFGFRPSPFQYSPSGPAPTTPGRRLTFFLDSTANPGVGIQPLRWQDQVLLPIPIETTTLPQIDREGLVLELRRALLSAALDSPDSNSLLILGGELPASAWGDPQSARAAFHHIANRPWIRPLNANDLLTLAPARDAGPVVQTPHSPYQPALSSAEHMALLQALQTAPDNPLTLGAWQAYQALFAPVYPAPAALTGLRASYISQVWSLLEAAHWAANPTPQLTCNTDPDHDNQPECLLANERMYAQFEIESGALTYLFQVQQGAIGYTCSNVFGCPPVIPQPTAFDRYHQLIGPTSQLITGLSDASSWLPGNGLASDPGIIPGAFADSAGPYRASSQNSTLIFESVDDRIRKTFSMQNVSPWQTRLEVAYQFSGAPPFTNISVPIVRDPWKRFTQDWRYLISPVMGDFANDFQTLYYFDLGYNLSYLRVEQNAAPMQIHSFDRSTSTPMFAYPENPEYEYPPNHFLPLPIFMIDLTISGDFSIQIETSYLPQ